MSDVEYQQDDTANSPASSMLQWLVVSAIVSTVVTLVAVHAPGRIKLLGLFSIGFGILSGWILGTLARHFHFKKKFAFTILSLVFILGSFVGMSVESHRIFENSIRAEYAIDPTKAFIQQVPPPTDKQAKKIYDDNLQNLKDEREKKLNELTIFSRYLKKRVSPLGKWQRPWPEIFWGIEVLLGAIAGSYFARRTAFEIPASKNESDLSPLPMDEQDTPE